MGHVDSLDGSANGCVALDAVAVAVAAHKQKYEPNRQIQREK